MAENSKIEWTDHTFNPWEGCQKVGPGCDHCYAETRNARFGGGTAVNWGPGAPRRRTSPANWRKPLQWNAQPFVQCTDRDCAWRGEQSKCATFDEPGQEGHWCPSCGNSQVRAARQRVFCASLADVFDNEVNPAWRRDLFRLIEATPNLDWLLLTKRIGNALPMIMEAAQAARDCTGSTLARWCENWIAGQAPHNVWMGATAVNQPEYLRDIKKLRAVPAVVHFLSMEPLLGEIDLYEPFVCEWCGGRGFTEYGPDDITCSGCEGHEYQPDEFGGEGIDWVIVGGESGPGARPMHPDWARKIQKQCTAAGVPFLFKQWGEWGPATDPESINRGEGMGGRLTETGRIVITPNTIQRIGKKAAGRLLDGVQHDGFPEVANGEH